MHHLQPYIQVCKSNYALNDQREREKRCFRQNPKQKDIRADKALEDLSGGYGDRHT